MSSQLQHPFLAKACSLVDKKCLLIGSVIATMIVIVLSASIAMLSLGLFASVVDEDSLLIITSESGYPSTNGSVILQACVFPSLSFAAYPTDAVCQNGNTFCPQSYSCASSDSQPICVSNTNTCKNETYCINYISALDWTDDDVAKKLELEDNSGSEIFYYICLTVIILFFIASLPVLYILKKKNMILVEKDEEPEQDEQKTKLLDSYNNILRDALENERIWDTRDVVTSLVISSTGIFFILLFMLGMTIIVATASPSIPTLDELKAGGCFYDNSIISHLKARLTNLVAFTIIGSVAVLVWIFLTVSLFVRRVFITLWNTKACCLFAGTTTILILGFGILATIIALT